MADSPDCWNPSSAKFAGRPKRLKLYARIRELKTNPNSGRTRAIEGSRELLCIPLPSMSPTVCKEKRLKSDLPSLDATFGIAAVAVGGQ